MALTYTTANNKITIIGSNPPSDGDLVIPSTINGLPVTSIGDWAFNGHTGLTSVTIPNTITSIGYSAFSDCSRLKSVTIPNSVTSIGGAAFAVCTGLTCVVIGNGVTSIGTSTFFECSGLTSVTIPNSVTSIGQEAFQYCSELTSVTIPNSVTEIGVQAFARCTGLTRVYFLGDAPSIRYNNSFFNSPATIYYIQGKTGWIATFAGRPTSTFTPPPPSIILRPKLLFSPDGKTITGSNPKATGYLVIPSTVTSIAAYAFKGCRGLTSVTIPASVTNIGYQAFQYCSGLTNITVNVANSFYTSDDGVLFNKDKTYLITFPPQKTGDYTIPNSVTSIGDYAFGGCSRLTSVTIPNSVTAIGNDAFNGCSGLTSVTIPNSVTVIGGAAFSRCYGLTSVYFMGNAPNVGGTVFEDTPATIYYIQGKTGWGATFVGRTTVPLVKVTYQFLFYIKTDFKIKITGINPQATEDLVIPSINWPINGLTVTSIGSYAFKGCRGLTSVTIPASVTSIGGAAFQGCSGLTKITVDVANSFYTSDDGVLFNKDKTSLIAFPPGKTGAYTIPDSVTSIGSYAFGGCSGLRSVTIPESVTSIGTGAFHSCRGLTSVTLPSSLTSIGQGVFKGCTGLTSVTIGSSVNNIDFSAFAQCFRLKSVTIPKSVKYIDGVAFDGTILKNVKVSYCFDFLLTWNTDNKATITDSYIKAFGDVVIPSTIDKQSVKDLTVGNTTSKAYGNGNLVWRSNIPDTDKLSVTSIGNLAFYGCVGLTSVTIPNSVTSIGSWAFASCIRLTSVTIPSSVTSIGEGAFFICWGLTNITVDVANSFYTSDNDILFNKAKTSLIAFPGGKTGGYTIPNSVTFIGTYAFGGCSRLTSVTIPNSVTSIGLGAFQSCTGLTSVTIPKSVKTIGDHAFSYCSGLTNITVDVANSFYTSDGGILFNKAKTSLIAFPAGKTGTYTIPNSVTSIGNWEFTGCSGLTSVTIPNSVTKIGSNAFDGCSGLTSVYFMGNAPSTGGDVFGDTTATIYYIQGKTGWNATFAGRPTAKFTP